MNILPVCVLVLLTGCAESGGNLGVLLVAHNESGREVGFFFNATFETSTSRVEYTPLTPFAQPGFSHYLGPGGGGALASFAPPCVPDGVLVLQVALDNGSSVGFRDEPGQAGCGPRTCTLRLLPDEVLLGCHSRSPRAIE